eukprot:9002148-Lingulodinium_polyedra.AAC.1
MGPRRRASAGVQQCAKAGRLDDRPLCSLGARRPCSPRPAFVHCWAPSVARRLRWPRPTFVRCWTAS